MKHLFKPINLILAALLLTTGFSSCGDDKGKNDDPEPPGNTGSGNTGGGTSQPDQDPDDFEYTLGVDSWPTITENGKNTLVAYIGFGVEGLKSRDIETFGIEITCPTATISMAKEDYKDDTYIKKISNGYYMYCIVSSNTRANYGDIISVGPTSSGSVKINITPRWERNGRTTYGATVSRTLRKTN